LLLLLIIKCYNIKYNNSLIAFILDNLKSDRHSCKFFFHRPKIKNSLALGMTMGSFDIGHRELLRTCSEPDLAGLFRTMKEDTGVQRQRAKSVDDISNVDEEVRCL